MLFSKSARSKTEILRNNTDNIQNKDKFTNFILKQNHPCVMAQSVFAMGNLDFYTYENFGSKKATKNILMDLKNYLSNYDFNAKEFFSFIAVFSDGKQYSEKEFEVLLWQQLNLLQEADETAWDKEVSDDPENGNFSFSLLGKAFYIVGMHPNSSRQARQSPQPTIVFNLHGQFEKLRKMGAYHTVRDKIRQRDEELQGTINPMLKDFGDDSEAKQYSGREVGGEWKCPFHH